MTTNIFDLDSPDHYDVRCSVRKLAEKEIPRYQNSNYYNTLPRELFKAFAGIGLTGLSIPDEFGGLGADPWTCALTFEEIAAIDLGPAIFTSVHSMVSGIVTRAGNKSQKEKYLPRMASGELLGAFALTEPSAGSDASGLRTTAQQDGKDFVLNGSKCYITSAGWADLYIVFAKTGKEDKAISAFVVEAGTPGLIISSPEKKMGCELSPIASLTFENMRIPAQQLLGELHRGYAIALSGLAGGRINIASCANGIARSALTRARVHLMEREQFGQKLSAFQGLQFMLADMQMKYEAARLLTWKAAHELAANPNAVGAKAGSSIAKCFATDAAMSISTDAVQLLGGAGYIKDYDVERYMRDAKMLQIVEGTNQIQRVVLAREILKPD
ncbi:MAG: acyl-CoA dehydrogenase family protein [Oligoflexia bacterium]|nr:acyl-CoA dehydrogenase family protein [Oligoflexia bacterium]